MREADRRLFEGLMQRQDEPALLLGTLPHLAWMDDAACQEHPEVSFFPAKGQSTRPAKSICAGCLVRAECLDFAMQHDAFGFDGVWGGLSPLERKALRRSRRNANQLVPAGQS